MAAGPLESSWSAGKSVTQWEGAIRDCERVLLPVSQPEPADQDEKTHKSCHLLPQCGEWQSQAALLWLVNTPVRGCAPAILELTTLEIFAAICSLSQASLRAVPLMLLIVPLLITRLAARSRDQTRGGRGSPKRASQGPVAQAELCD